jgi:uncharacterized protein YtpQ (UPF0354 family)
MKTIKTEIKLYEYSELNKEAKERAFNEHEEFLRENPATYENGEIIEKYDNMDEWALNEIKEYVEDSINANEYLFFESGEMANITHFTGKHEKAGKTEFCFLGKTYLI